MSYTAVIGLEIHMQLRTKRKMFAEEGAIYGAPPNTQTTPTSLAHPGTMPVPNKKAIEYAIKMGLACKATITNYNWFDRKNYTYADLPKGFQITQDKTPICTNGVLEIDLSAQKTKKIRIARIQLEEDTGKSIHSPHGNITLLNFDRAGMPLIEVVTQPDFSSAAEAASFLKEIRRLGRYLGICDGNMEEGSLRCDANVSIMPEGSKTLGTKVELKNMNSIRHVRLAINEEIERQKRKKASGEKIHAETRTYNIETGETIYQRSKETLTDYRFFTEPDISPFYVSDAWIHRVQASMPTLPRVLAKKFREAYQLPYLTATALTDDKESGLFFEALCQQTKHYKIAANWVLGPIRSHLNKQKIKWSAFPLATQTMAKLTNMVAEERVGFSIAAQTFFPALLRNPAADPEHLLETRGAQVSNPKQLETWVQQALSKYPEKVAA